MRTSKAAHLALCLSYLVPALLLARSERPAEPAAIRSWDGPWAAETVPTAQPSPSPRPEASLEAARRHRRNGDLAAALSEYRQAVATGQAPPEARLELAQVEQASDHPEAARETLLRLLASGPDDQLRSRARLELATVELALGDWESALDHADVASAPDGLEDLVVLRRAQALAMGGAPGEAVALLRSPDLRASTNRIILQEAGNLAERLGVPDLAAPLYAQAARYPGWTADRGRLIKAAGAAFAQAGAVDRAVEQYRTLVELYGWTAYAQEAAEELERLGGLTAYHRGLIAMSEGRYPEARAAFVQAAAGGPYVNSALSQARRLQEVMAWQRAVSAGSPEAFQSFRRSYPAGSLAAEAWFQEGLVHYQAGQFREALAVWEEAARGTSGDDRARMHLWAGKALESLGQAQDAQARFEAAASTHPTGYYALRARDLLAGIRGWPGDYPEAMGGDGVWAVGTERAEAEAWLADWAGPDTGQDPADEVRVQRGLGLLALGLMAEATAEFEGAIEESHDGWTLFRLAELLTQYQLWSPATRAALRLIALSPAKTVTEAPPAIQRLAYPPAYWDLAIRLARQHGIGPWLLLALVRQESRYDPFAISIAEARGLTQVIPPTARGIATALGRQEFRIDDLYRPTVSMEFGAWYLGQQLRMFNNDPFMALAAYNAGPGNALRWVTEDPDLFVERIAYSETRSYVRQVYVHHAMYRALRPSP